MRLFSYSHGKWYSMTAYGSCLIAVQVQTTRGGLGEYQHREFREHGTVPVLLLSIYLDERCAQCGTTVPETHVVEQYAVSPPVTGRQLTVSSTLSVHDSNRLDVCLVYAFHTR